MKNQTSGKTQKATVFAVVACCLVAIATSARAQDAGAGDASESAFTLSSSEVFTTKDHPSFSLTFRHLPQLDFRVYRVRDPFTFFSGLRDAHQLGSAERPVAQERSWLERIADWKSRQRRQIRSFVRDQVSYAYRVERRASSDQQEIAQRVVLNETSFARVPLLNPDQLVTSWRELLPDRRDAEYRRIPLEVTAQPGVYLVEAVSNLLRAYTIVIVSDLGLVTKTSPGQLLMFAANRFSGEPKAGCDVQVMANQQPLGAGQTGADGTLALTVPSVDAEDIVGIARCGDEITATDPGGWFAHESPRELLGYIYTDKPIYRPGHTVHLKAVLRWRERDAVLPFDRPNAEVAVSDTNDKVVFRQSLAADGFGAVAASFAVPTTGALGFYTVTVSSGDQEATGGFEVQEYRRPEFEVILTPASRFVVQGNDAIATVQARYYFGQPVANGRVRYVVNQQAYYSPLRWSDESDEEGGGQSWYGDEQKIQGELRLDAQGRGEIRVPLDEDENGRDYSARIEAQVTDASSREVSGNTIVHATYGPFLLSARVDGYVFKPSERVQVNLKAVDYAGSVRAAVAVRVELERIRYPEGRYSDPAATPVSQSTVTTGADGLATVSLTLPGGPGTYRARSIAASDGREIRADSWIYVAGRNDELTGEDRYLELTADKRSYAPGETARLLVRGEAVTGPILVTKEGQSVTWHRVLRPTAGDALEVPIDAGDVGDIYVNIVFLRDGRLNQAERRLSVPAADRVLQVTLTADRPAAKPQEPGVFFVHVSDWAGAPVAAQISLGVIDEAVYAIRPDSTADPVRFFYRREYTRVSTSFSRDYYFVGYSGTERLQLASRRRRPFTLADFKGDKQVQPQVRKDFPDAIFWIGDLVTDAAGQARVSLKYPDALTTWRLTARAVTRDTRAGTVVARTTTTKDLIVRVVTPRFLTEGDEVVIPTIVHNYLEGAKDTSVTFAAKGLESQAPTSTTGSIDSNGERRDDWRFRASTAGSATVTATAKTDTDGDAVELTIPVVPYGLRRDVGTSGALRSAGEQTTDLTIPAASNPASRTVSVSLAPSMAGSLLGALDFLTSYPYGCTEQTLSTFLPNVMVTRALTQLKLAPAERLSALDRQVAEGLKRLGDFQHEDGGWGWWKTDQNHPFMTAYAVYGLIEAKRAGYRIDDSRVENGAQRLAAMYAEYPRAEPDLKAYVAYVLRRAAPQGEPLRYQGASGQAQFDPAEALNTLWEARDRMSAYGRALCCFC
jgi:alpha-2-macroglobulin